MNGEKEVNIYPACPIQTVPLGKQIVDKEKFFYLEVSQIINEEEMKVEYHHFVTPNESTDIGIKHQMAAIITKQTPDIMCLLMEHNTISEADFPK